MRKLYERVAHDLDIKLAAVLLAVVTWYYLATAGVEPRLFPAVPVRIVNLPDDVALLSLDVREATIELKGPRGRLDVLEGRGLVVEIDLQGTTVEPGQPLNRSIRVSGSLVRVEATAGRTSPLLAAVRFLTAAPAAVTLTLTRMTARVVPVRVELAGEPAPGFEARHTVTPRSVRVRGPFLLLQTLGSIDTEPVSIAGIQKGRSVKARLRREVPTHKFGVVPIFPAQATVDVAVTVTEKPDERTVERVAVRLAALPPGVAVLGQDVTEVTVRLKGPRGRLRDLDAQSLVAEISLEGATAPGEPEPESHFLLRENIRQVVARAASLPLGPSVELLGIEPKAVQVTLDRLDTRSLPVRAVLEGQPAEGYELGEATVVPERVTVRGPRSVVGKLEAIDTLPVLVGGVSERLRRTARLVERVSAGKFQAVAVEPSQRLVDVVVDVREHTARKTLKGLPIHVVLESDKVGGMRVELRPRVVEAVGFVGPKSRMDGFGADAVVAFVRLQIASIADLRPTIRTVEFHIRDPKVHLVPETKAVTVNIDFPPLEAPPAPPKPREKRGPEAAEGD